MKIYRKTINVQSKGGYPTFVQITDHVRDAVASSGIQNGFCLVYTHHTTCSIAIQECSFDTSYNGLEYLQQDLVDLFEGLIPTCRKEGQYMHPGPELTAFSQEHGESKAETLNTDAHLRSMFLGRSETIILADDELDLGKFGHVYFIDFDQTRPREREIQIQVMGE